MPPLCWPATAPGGPSGVCAGGEALGGVGLSAGAVGLVNFVPLVGLWLAVGFGAAAAAEVGVWAVGAAVGDVLVLAEAVAVALSDGAGLATWSPT
ncbi:hypothetical protein GCM10009738_64730 [Kitasatospora viridis]|uniref:Uncharacterized protein n=1 Tax=Kitasatospora viridis TaxID=281105 RepID=A0A561UKL4_9ACTN|nr:hypothetical protein FHX73_113763 [Kitasatospora viridis]